MRILVTGAASPLGRVVARLFLERGHRVVGLARRFDGLKLIESLGAEAVMGDVRRPEQVTRAVSGCNAVVHAAGYFDFWEPSRGIYETVNVDATRVVLAAARQAGARRVVLCSSAITIGGDSGGRTALERSKIDAERLALRARRPGFEVVVVNSALVVAAGDSGWVGRLFQRAAAGGRPIVSGAPLGWVYVEDAAQGIVRATERGTDGTHYALSGETMSTRRVLQAVTTSIGAPAPRELSERRALAEAMLHTAIASPIRRRPAIAIDEARFLHTGFAVDGSFARHELGLQYTPSARWLPLVARQYGIAVRKVATAR